MWADVVIHLALSMSLPIATYLRAAQDKELSVEQTSRQTRSLHVLGPDVARGLMTKRELREHFERSNPLMARGANKRGAGAYCASLSRPAAFAAASKIACALCLDSRRLIIGHTQDCKKGNGVPSGSTTMKLGH